MNLRPLAALPLLFLCAAPLAATKPTARFHDGTAFVTFPNGVEREVFFPLSITEETVVSDAFTSYLAVHFQDPDLRYDPLVFLASRTEPKDALGTLIRDTYRSYLLRMDLMRKISGLTEIACLDQLLERIRPFDTAAALQLLSVVFYETPTIGGADVAEMAALAIGDRLAARSPAGLAFKPNDMLPADLPDLLRYRAGYLDEGNGPNPIPPLEFFADEVTRKFLLTLETFGVLIDAERPPTAGDLARIADFVGSFSAPAEEGPNVLQQAALLYLKTLPDRTAEPSVRSCEERIRNGSDSMIDRIGSIKRTIEPNGTSRNGTGRGKNGYVNDMIRRVTRGKFRM